MHFVPRRRPPVRAARPPSFCRGKIIAMNRLKLGAKLLLASFSEALASQAEQLQSAIEFFKVSAGTQVNKTRSGFAAGARRDPAPVFAR